MRWLLGVALTLTLASTASAAAPNIVIIQTDDQTLESMRVMDDTRRLVGGAGMTFDRYYVSYSLCCPSRASLLTGQYSHNTGVRGNLPPEGSVYAFDDRRTLPVWLQRAGYVTGHIGKYLNLYAYGTPPGWTEWRTGIDPTTYRYYEYALNENGVPRRYGNAPADYQTDVLTRQAVDFVQRRAPAEAPFFLALDYVAPHDEIGTVPRLLPGGPPLPAPRHAGLEAGTQLPVDASFDEEDVSDKPSHVQSRPPLTDAERAEILSYHRARLESLHAVDDGVRDVMTALESSGELENTFVLFLSDNGYMQGQHRYPKGKLAFYEPSTHVPLLIRGPGIPAGTRTTALAANVDIAPTLAVLAGAHPDLVVDGQALTDVLRHPETELARDVLHEFVKPGDLVARANPEGSGGPDPSFTGVRSSEGLVYVEHEGGERELYDLRTDPLQLENVADEAAFADAQAGLAARLAILRGCSGATCR